MINFCTVSFHIAHIVAIDNMTICNPIAKLDLSALIIITNITVSSTKIPDLHSVISRSSRHGLSHRVCILAAIALIYSDHPAASRQKR